MKNEIKKLKRKKEFPTRALLSAIALVLQLAIIIGLIMLLIFFDKTINYIWIPLIINYVLSVVISIYLINTDTQNNFKNSWLVIIILVPIVGYVLYLLFAQKITATNRKKLKSSKINNYLDLYKKDSTEELKKLQVEHRMHFGFANYLYRSSYSSLYTDSEVKYYNYGQKGFPVMLDELKKAKKFIFLEYFIIEFGQMFGSIYNILKQKAAEGVEVRIIYDDLGSLNTMSANFFKIAKKDNINVIPFNRIRPIMDVKQNSRDHRKILVIDGLVGFTGGCNLADEYINKVKRFGDWRDNMVMIKGNAVDGLTRLFLSTWSILIKGDFSKELDFNHYSYQENVNLRENNFTPSGYVQTFGEVPFDDSDTAKNLLLRLIFNSVKSIKMSSPYLIIDDDILNALVIAASSGVEVSLVLPGIPDKKIVKFMATSYYTKLINAGVKVYEYTKGFNHAKVYLFDDRTCLTGTINLDYRSLYLHYENGIFLYGNECIKDIKDDLDLMISQSKLQDEKKYIHVKWYSKVCWAILRVFSPLI